MNYQAHLTTNAVVAIPIAYMGGRINFSLTSIVLFFAGYSFGTFVLSPDLDCHSQPYKNWGPLKFIWKPYQLFPHRSIFTHTPIIGTVGRLFYVHVAFILPLCGILFVLNWLGIAQFQSPIGAIIERYMSLIQNHPRGVMALIMGLELSAIGHLIGDLSSTLVKKILNKIARSKKSVKTSKPQNLALP